MNGLPSKFNSFKSSIKTRGCPIEFLKLASLLGVQDLNISRDTKLNTTFKSNALTAQNRYLITQISQVHILETGIFNVILVLEAEETMFIKGLKVSLGELLVVEVLLL